ncbi:hypothetical protein ACQCX2_07655 [Propionibacteriaceae bacterium Y1700]
MTPVLAIALLGLGFLLGYATTLAMVLGESDLERDTLNDNDPTIGGQR